LCDVFYPQPQVCGVPVQTRGLGAVPLVDAGALKTDRCLATLLLVHLGQLIFSRGDNTMISK
jgi:hypothetical protein